MKKIIYWILCIIFLICLIYIFIFAKNKYCYSYKSLDLTKMDSLKVQYAKKLIVDRAWEIYRPKPDTDYDAGTGDVYISKYDIKDMDMLIKIIKNSDRKKSFVENFNVIAGANRLEIFADGKKVKLPAKGNGVSAEELKHYKKTTKRVYDILDPYITPTSTIIMITNDGHTAHAEVFPVSSMIFYKAKGLPDKRMRRVEKYVSRFWPEGDFENSKYILNLNYYDFIDPLLCCDQYSIDERLKENLKDLSEGGNLDQDGKRRDYFNHHVNLDQLNGTNEQDYSFFSDNFHNYSHRYKKAEEISLAGKYLSIIDMQHSAGIGLPMEFGIKVNACNFK
ncbi:hypothetical protein P255_02665 [Acinetobacter brisouii CIP 110357]|uniref:Uncharacterized protein n=1 Tax=Acinetobacter brisouii CIP 110357 TaxID=1341683 RepID=V2UJK6_9GAMM|nr:hypothetical protein [Acinetobacter brisouii]ENV48914.1 hypothetical protein F954_00054 [Acinetobacter brisouii ANC 4119]ESK50167.1 hypothetical protein P255_02665 [Acinetobacter brisouii CIP 110357]